MEQTRRDKQSRRKQNQTTSPGVDETKEPGAPGRRSHLACSPRLSAHPQAGRLHTRNPGRGPRGGRGEEVEGAGAPSTPAPLGPDSTAEQEGGRKPRGDSRMAPGAGRGGSRVTGPGAASRAAVRAPRPERAPEPARSAPAGLPGGASPPPGWAPVPAVRAPGRAPGVERQVPAVRLPRTPDATFCTPQAGAASKGRVCLASRPNPRLGGTGGSSRRGREGDAG